MTREEVIKELKEYEDGLDLEYATPFDKAIMYAIKALEQEPTTKNDLGVDREDAVERLKAIKQLIGYDKDSEIVKATQKSLDMAIKAIEQEPILNRHGRLIDADGLMKYFTQHEDMRFDVTDIEYLIDHAPTIIEADRSEKE